ncbi:MAG: glycosyltransferase family 1 protein [Planctomycetota bacterium]
MASSNRILIDYRPALFGRAGIARYVRELTRALAESAHGFDLRLFGAAWRRAPWPADALLPRWAPRLPGRLLPFLNALGLGADMLGGGAELFHYTDVVFPPVRRARRLITIHDLLFESAEPFHGSDFRRIVARRVARELARADHVIAVSAATGQDVVARHGIAASQVTVVPLGCDHVDRLLARAELPRGFASTPPFILFAGTLEPRKNVARLLTAFDRIASQVPHRLVIAGGSGWMMEALPRLVHACSSHQRIILLGHVADSELVALYREAQLFVYPSLAEGFGLPVAEALRLGVPVVTAAHTPMAAMFAAAVALADPRDVDSLAQAMLSLVQDRGRCTRLREAGLALTRNLTWSETARRTLAVYRALLE